VIDGEERDKQGRVIKSDPLGWNRYMYVKGNPVGYSDPDGREKIYAFDKNDKDNKQHIKAAEDYKNDGAIHIFLHSNNKHLKVNMGKGDKLIKDAEGLHNFLMQHSKTYKNSKDRSKLTIIFHSCRTAGKRKDGKDSIAKKISKSEIFRNNRIIGATTRTWTSADGTDLGAWHGSHEDAYGNFIGKRDANGHAIDHYPIAPAGRWLILQGGNVVRSFHGTWMPKEYPTVKDILNKQ
jgi:uncharacterized protein RhaS with RHS repeats